VSEQAKTISFTKSEKKKWEEIQGNKSDTQTSHKTSARIKAAISKSFLNTKIVLQFHGLVRF